MFGESTNPKLHGIVEAPMREGKAAAGLDLFMSCDRTLRRRAPPGVSCDGSPHLEAKLAVQGIGDEDGTDMTSKSLRDSDHQLVGISAIGLF
jgi:hypothetical protein